MGDKTTGEDPAPGCADDARRRPVRSFVRRAGRMTRAQARAMDELWPQFGVEFTGRQLDLSQLFGRDAPRTLEIGFGNGESLATLAARHPDRDFLGIEVHRPGVGHLLLQIEQAGLTNVRVICHDAYEILQAGLADRSLDQLLLFFADPWPKKRHHKRRIVQPQFVDLIAQKLRPGGVFHAATDWENYAEHIFLTLDRSTSFNNRANGSDFESGAVPRPDSRPVTKFETRGRRLGHAVRDYVFVRRQV